MGTQAAASRRPRRRPSPPPKARAPRLRARTTRRRRRRRTSAVELLGLVMVGVGIFLGLSLAFGAGGPAGEMLESGVRIVIGRGVILAPFLLVGVGLLLMLRHPILGMHPLRLGAALGAAAVLLALASGVLGAGGAPRTGWFENASVSERGGQVGEGLFYVTSTTIGTVGTALLVVLMAAAAAILISGASLSQVLRSSGKGAVVASRSVGRGVATTTASAVRGSQHWADQIRLRLDRSEAPTLVPTPRGRSATGGGDGHPLDGADDFPDIYREAGRMPRSPALGAEADDDDADGVSPVAGSVRPAPEQQVFEPLIPVGPRRPHEYPDPSRPAVENGHYRTPSARLLRRSRSIDGVSGLVVEQTSRALEETLSHFGIEATVANAISGPRVTRYELQLAPGTKIGRVSALRDDLAYSLAAQDELRIIAPIPGKQAIGVEVPNPDSQTVTLGDIFREFPDRAGPLTVWLGLDIGGKPVYADLARMPHLLIAGSTGTGKSVCLNALLASILLRATPRDLRMILIDPKKVELNHYESIPHLLTPVVTNMKDAAAVLSNIVREMENRYELMGMARARNLRDWNEVREREGQPPMPMILLVIDELADLMMVAPAEVEDAIIRLAQKSRAVGIHLVLATQRPSVDVITGMIKANVPSRIAFAVSSQVDSRVVLDANGAESLLGQGDMLFRPIGTSRLQRLQGAYVSEEEILAITEHWRRQGRPVLREELLERPVRIDEPDTRERDEMLDAAIETVVQQGTASVSLLQRRLGVGYARAGRLVDQLEQLGVVSGHEGSKPRKVLIGESDAARMLGHRETDADEPEPRAG
jgi:S-DNA-T family DNA segregation ATPase FtsK/SpoIIIE